MLLCIVNPSACGWNEGRKAKLTLSLNENLYTDREWLAAWCYVFGQEGVWYRLPLETPSLEHRSPQVWYLGDQRSATISTHERSLLTVRAFCQALELPFGEPQSLGQIAQIHLEPDWNATRYIFWSEGAANRFMVIHSVSCQG